MRKIAAGLLITGVAVGLAGCGEKKALALRPDQTQPPAPYGSEQRPGAVELLDPPTLAIPQRSVELRTRSERREDDAFDLPPPE